MMASVDRRVTGGVDTHNDVNVAAVCDTATSRTLATKSFPTTSAGYACLLTWVNSHGTLDRVGVEATDCWSARVARHLTMAGIKVIEANRPDRDPRRLDVNPTGGRPLTGRSVVGCTSKLQSLRTWSTQRSLSQKMATHHRVPPTLPTPSCPPR